MVEVEFNSSSCARSMWLGLGKKTAKHATKTLAAVISSVRDIGMRCRKRSGRNEARKKNFGAKFLCRSEEHTGRLAVPRDPREHRWLMRITLLAHAALDQSIE